MWKQELIFILICVLMGLILALALITPANAASSSFVLNSSMTGLETEQDLVKELLSAKEGDEIVIYNSGIGGYSDTALSLFNAITASKAHVIVDVLGGAQSAHALISCAADTLILRPNAFLMFHAPRYMNDVTGKIIPIDIDNISTPMSMTLKVMTIGCAHLLHKDSISAILAQGMRVYVYKNEAGAFVNVIEEEKIR